MRLAAIEAGGTKMVCAIGDSEGNIEVMESFPTKTPEETCTSMYGFFDNYQFDAMGIACFGPIQLDKAAKDYGCITTTPKLAWKNFNIVKAFADRYKVPVGFDTDVNGSVLGEVTYGIGKGLKSCIYITIGTGVGVGVIADGKLMHGMLHPEGGHILLSRVLGDDYKCRCPYHDNCFEGLCAGPAIEDRWGKSAKELFDREEVWQLEAKYIAQALVNYVMILSPQRIILGGGVMHQTQLLPLIRQEFAKALGGYIKTKEIEDLDSYIVVQSLDDKQGVLGALKLAEMAM